MADDIGFVAVGQAPEGAALFLTLDLPGATKVEIGPPGDFGDPLEADDSGTEFDLDIDEEGLSLADIVSVVNTGTLQLRVSSDGDVSTYDIARDFSGLNENTFADFSVAVVSPAEDQVLPNTGPVTFQWQTGGTVAPTAMDLMSVSIESQSFFPDFVDGFGNPYATIEDGSALFGGDLELNATQITSPGAVGVGVWEADVIYGQFENSLDMTLSLASGSDALGLSGDTIRGALVYGDGVTFSVGVPEPGSMALLSLGGLLIARRRRG